LTCSKDIDVERSGNVLFDSAVAWTGTEFIVWGGSSFSGFGGPSLADGAAFDP
jgi:hypothetical protein